MILLVGQVPRAFRGREAWQELDYAQVFGGIAKAAWEVDSAARIPEHMAEAFSTRALRQARAGRAGAPRGRARRGGGRRRRRARRARRASSRGRRTSSGCASCSAAAERPLVVVGEGGWTAETSRDVQAFCEANELPVACAFRCQDFVDNRSPSYVGVLGVAMDEAIAARLRDADLVLAIGGRLGEVPTRRYTLLEPPDPRQTLVHVHPDPAELGRVYEPDLAIAATLPELAAALRALDPIEPRWREWTAAARADYERNLEHEPMEGDVDLGEIMAFLRRRLPGDAVQTCGAGNFTVWAHRFAQFTQFGTQACPRSGSMGYGLPAAVAAKLVHPDRDRRLLHRRRRLRHELPELATAVQYDLPIVVLLVNNGMYATIRMHQERQFPGRVIGTDLENPDFPALARAYGAHGERVERTEDFEAAFERALASGKPSVLELPVDPGADQPAREAERAAGGRDERGDPRRRARGADLALHRRGARRRLPPRLRDRRGRRRGRLVGGDDVVAQTRQVFENMRAVLAAGGCGFEDVVKVTVFLTDIDDRPLINPVRQEVFGETRPASTLVEVPRLAVEGAKVEIECVALVP